MSKSTITGPIHPLKGIVQLPLSKSIANRILIIDSLMGKQRAFPENELPEDVVVMQQLLNSADGQLNAKHAGTVYRFLLARLCIKEGSFILDGSERMRKRPIGILVDSLNSLGADIQYLSEEGYPPVRITGRKLSSNGKALTLRADVSSQFISALMMIAPYIEGGLELQLEGKVLSRPYIQLTANLMEEAGAEISLGTEKIAISQTPYKKPVSSLERDWSAAPYFLSLLFLQDGKELFFPGLTLRSLQGDSAASNWFEEIGITGFQQEDGVAFQLKKNIHSDLIVRNFSDQPDLVPTFAMLCLAGGIKARFSGCDNLNLKESKRLDVLRETVKSCGAKLLPSHSSNELFFDPPSTIQIPENLLFDTLDDHRLAMSYSLLSCREKTINIAQKEVVKKSFPAFWNELTKIGFEVVDL